MENTGKWSVEAKEFEILIKGGMSGVRIVERRKEKQRSIFVRRDEIAWLLGALVVVVDVDTSEVFWDQSRAGYPRLITQKCSNRHGHFLTIEEFDGRRRSGSILIPEGRYGQGWARLIKEISIASSALKVGRGIRDVKPAKVVSGRRSYAEVVGLMKSSEEECFQTYTEPIARVPRWLKGSSTAVVVPTIDSADGEKIASKNHPAPGMTTNVRETGGVLRRPKLCRGKRMH